MSPSAGGTPPPNLVQKFDAAGNPARLLRLGLLHQRQRDHRYSLGPLRATRGTSPSTRAAISTLSTPATRSSTSRTPAASSSALSPAPAPGRFQHPPHRRRHRPHERQCARRRCRQPGRRRIQLLRRIPAPADRHRALAGHPFGATPSRGLRSCLVASPSSSGYVYVADAGVVDIFTPAQSSPRSPMSR